MAHEQPHDKLIKETMSYRQEAERFFRQFLPAHISNRLNYSTLKIENTTFVNQQAREFYADLHFSCEWDSGDEAKIFNLIEHKSRPEQRPHLQMGCYISEAYVLQVKQQRKEKKNELLVPIIPILLYHGTEKWEKKQYESYFNLPDPALRSYLPGFDIIFINLADISDEEIIAMGATFLTTTFLLFKHKDDKDFILNNASKLFTFVESDYTAEETARIFSVVILYLFKAFQFLKPEIETIGKKLPKNTQDMFISTYDMLMEEGEAIGIQKGEAIGIQKGEAIGIQKGEAIGKRQNSLETVMKSIVKFPSFSDAEIADLSGMPEAFVSVFRKNLLKGNTRTAQKIAVGAFSDLPGFSDADASKVKALVKAAMDKHLNKTKKQSTVSHESQ